MRNIKLTIEYDGTCFKGWQVQKGDLRTVSGEIIKAAQKLFHKRIKLIGSGRTDTHVHAKGQVANFHVNSTIPAENIKSALNAFLPHDIVILKAEEVPEEFHAQYCAKRKTYRYTILNRPNPSALARNYALHYPYPLNLNRMRSESKCLIGQHDFKSFQAADPSKVREDTVRTVYLLNIRKKEDYIIIEIEANGFLYKMVRNIVGTLLEIGNKSFGKDCLKMILQNKDRAQAGSTAQPQGLCLMSVQY